MWQRPSSPAIASNVCSLANWPVPAARVLKLLTLGLDYAARTTQWKQATPSRSLSPSRDASARFMNVFQEGLQTLAKLRTGGKQTVVRPACVR